MPYMSPLLGEVIKNRGVIDPPYFSRACRETVNFQAALEAGRYAGIFKDGSVWVEIGAHSICSHMVNAALDPPISVLPSLRHDIDSFRVLADSLSSLYLADLDLQWNGYYRDFKDALSVLKLPCIIGIVSTIGSSIATTLALPKEMNVGDHLSCSLMVTYYAVYCFSSKSGRAATR